MARGGGRQSFGGLGCVRYDDIGKKNEVDEVIGQSDRQADAASKDVLYLDDAIQEGEAKA